MPWADSGGRKRRLIKFLALHELQLVTLVAPIHAPPMNQFAQVMVTQKQFESFTTRIRFLMTNYWTHFIETVQLTREVNHSTSQQYGCTTRSSGVRQKSLHDNAVRRGSSISWTHRNGTMLKSITNSTIRRMVARCNNPNKANRSSDFRLIGPSSRQTCSVHAIIPKVHR